jgi:hypothetical protein
MLQKLRHLTKGWVAVVIFSLISLTFVFWGVLGYLESHNRKPGSVAEVYGKPIMASDVRTYADQMGISPNDALQQLIMQNVWGHIVPDLSLDDTFSALSNTSFILPKDKDYFYNILKNYSNFNYLKFNASLFRDQAKASVKKTPELDKKLKQYYASHKQDFYAVEQRDYSYIHVVAEDIGANIAPPTAQQIQQFYHSHPQSFPNAQESWGFQELAVVAADQTKADQLIKQLSKEKNLTAYHNEHKKTSKINTFRLHAGRRSQNDVLKTLKNIGDASKPVYKQQYNAVFVVKLVHHYDAVVEPSDNDKIKIIKWIKDGKFLAHAAQLDQKIQRVMLRQPSSLTAIQSALSSTAVKVKIQTTDLQSADALNADKLFGNQKVRNAIKVNAPDLENKQVVGPIQFRAQAKAAGKSKAGDTGKATGKDKVNHAWLSRRLFEKVYDLPMNAIALQPPTSTKDQDASKKDSGDQNCTSDNCNILVIRLKQRKPAYLQSFEQAKPLVEKAFIEQQQRALAAKFIVKVKTELANNKKLSVIKEELKGSHVYNYQYVNGAKLQNKEVILDHLLDVDAKDRVGSFIDGNEYYLVHLTGVDNKSFDQLKADTDKWFGNIRKRVQANEQLHSVAESVNKRAKAGGHVKLYDN